MLVGPLAQNFSVIQHQNFIRMAQGTDPLGNDNGRDPGVRPVQGVAQVRIVR